MQFSELPALRVAFLISAGILTLHVWPVEGVILPFLVLITLFLLGFQFLDAVWVRTKCSLSTHGWLYPTAVNWVWMLTVYLTGASVMGLAQIKKVEERRRHNWTEWAFAEDLQILGTISAVRETASGSSGQKIVEIRIDSIGFTSRKTEKAPGLVRWRRFQTGGRFTLEALGPTLNALPEAEDSAQSIGEGQLVEGREIKAIIRLYPAKANDNPGGFNYREWLEKQGLYVQGIILSYDVSYAVSAESSGHFHSLKQWVPNLSWISQLRQGILQRLDTHFSKEAAPFLKAFLIGDKRSLEAEVKEAFSRAGLSHIMAVSGLHVGFLLTPFWICLPMFRRWKYGPVIGLVLLSSLMWIYASLTGFSTSVNRASLMAVLLGFGSLFSKSRNSINQMAAAATGILVISPKELLEPGFQLSFGAVTMLLLWMPATQQRIERVIPYRWVSSIVQVMSVTMVVQTGLTPILAYWFGELSLMAPISNLLVVPILSFLMPMTIILVGFAPLAEGVPWVFQLMNGMVKWILFVSEQAGQEDFAMRLLKPSLTAVLTWIGLLWTALPSMEVRDRWKRIRTVLILLLISGTMDLTELWRPKPFRLVVLDVGQGDALFFQTPAGKNYLVDTGTWSPGWNSGRGVLLPFFKQERIERIHGLFLTHPHADHVGGAPELLSHVQIDTVYRPYALYESELNRELDSLIWMKRIPERNPKAGESFLLGGEIQVFILSPNVPKSTFSNPSRATRQREMQNVNDASLVMKWMYGEVSFMLTGDAESGIEQEIMERFESEAPNWLVSTVLKVGHHGSKTSSTSAFIEAVSPQTAIVSVSYRNRYRHPHKEISERLTSATGSAKNVYFTSLDGPILLLSDSKKIRKIVPLKER